MFKLSEHPWHFKISYYLVFIIVLLRQVRTLMAPFLGSELAYTFRSDNFFSFSGGQIRRGLIGEKLILLQEWGFDAVFFYSLLLLVFFSFCYLVVFPRLLQSFKVQEAYLILLSGFFLLPGIDREIFMLIPALYYYLSHKNDFLFYFLLGISAFIHELTLLLYFPFIWILIQDFWRIRKWQPLFYFVMVMACFAVVIGLKSELNLIPEREFWPQHGVEGLEDHFLYGFAGKGLMATLKLHGSVILGKVETLYALPGLAAFFVLLALTLKHFGAAAISLYYYIAINVLLFLLTIDYGRYFYLLFFFYLIISQSGLLAIADRSLRSFRFLMPKFVEGWLSFKFNRTWYQIALLIFVIAPFGYWLGDTLLKPALWQELEQLIDFHLPKYAGE